MSDFSNRTVLVVDDSSTMRTIIRGMLERLGFRSIEEAESGETALEKLRGRGFSLVICDWHMGGMSGLEVLREFRQLRTTTTSCRFIFATSERSWGHQTSAKVDGADGFLSKPFAFEALKAKIELVMRR